MARLKKSSSPKLKIEVNHEELWDKHGGAGKDKPLANLEDLPDGYSFHFHVINLLKK